MVFRLRLLTVVGAAVRDGRYEIGLLGDLKNGGERCDRPSAGSYDPDERPALVRRMPASTPRSHGARTLPLIRQSAAYPENVRWSVGPVTYVGLNIPGSDNNAPRYDANGKQVDGDAAAYAARNAANLAWIARSFAGNALANVTRVQTVGSTQNHWVRATVDPQDPEIFTFRQHIVRANVPQYTAP